MSIVFSRGEPPDGVGHAGHGYLVLAVASKCRSRAGVVAKETIGNPLRNHLLHNGAAETRPVLLAALGREPSDQATFRCHSTAD